jgi:tetratricopeptide (TPR) repeat protein
MKPMRRGRLWSWSLPALAAVLMVTGCDRIDAMQAQVRATITAFASGAKPQTLDARDVAAESLGLPEPLHERLDRWHGAPLPSPLAQARIAARRAFFAGEFELVESAFMQAHDAYVKGATPQDETERLLYPLRTVGLAGVPRCEQWTKAMPRSYAARYVCARMWQQGAWMARSEEAASKVSERRFALMRARLRRSNELLEQAIASDVKPIQALTLLSENLHLLADHERAAAVGERALALMPAHAAAHTVAARYAMPDWGGSEERLTAAVERARQAGVHRDGLTSLEDQQLARPWRTATPGAEKLYWEKALAEHVSAERLHALAMYYLRLQNWRDALPVLERSIRDHPHVAESHYWRGRVHQELGNPQGALADYRMAAALGDEDAINHLIYAHLQGGLTLPPRDLAALAGLCRHAAGLGSPAGANCLASSHWDGALPGIARNPAQALAWHLLAARGGSRNSQHDLGWLLMSRPLAEVKAPEAREAREAGIFWLQRAAEQGHPFAARKLQEAGIDLDNAEPPRRR